MVHVKITTVGTFQVVSIPAVDVEKVVYKIFLILEKINKNSDIFTYVSAIEEKFKTDKISGKSHSVQHNQLEIVIVPILNNYMLTLSCNVTRKIFSNPKIQIVQKFIENNFLSFMVPNDPAITIKKSFVYQNFSNHPICYITWNKKYGKIEQYIEYDSYTTILKGAQKDMRKPKNI